MKKLVVILGAVILVVAGCWRVARTPECRFLCGKDPETRFQAVREIYRKPDWRTKWVLPRIIRDRETNLVIEGLFIIVQRGFVELAPNVRALYEKTDDPLLQAEALLVLGELRVPEIGAMAREAMLSDHTEIRCAGASVAKAADDVSLTPLLLTLAESGTPEERRTALKTLIKLRSRLCLPLLVNELETESVLTGDTALMGLMDITGKNEGLDFDAWRKTIRERGE